MIEWNNEFRVLRYGRPGFAIAIPYWMLASVGALVAAIIVMAALWEAKP